MGHDPFEVTESPLGRQGMAWIQANCATPWPKLHSSYNPTSCHLLLYWFTLIGGISTELPKGVFPQTWQKGIAVCSAWHKRMAPYAQSILTTCCGSFLVFSIMSHSRVLGEKDLSKTTPSSTQFSSPPPSPKQPDEAASLLSVVSRKGVEGTILPASLSTAQ